MIWLGMLAVTAVAYGWLKVRRRRKGAAAAAK